MTTVARMKNLLISLIAALALGLCGAAAAQAATFSDPAGDNCAGGYCGPDLTGVGYRLGTDGTLFLSVTRNGSTCSTLSYPATEVQPAFVLFAADATSPGDHFGFIPRTGVGRLLHARLRLEQAGEHRQRRRGGAGQHGHPGVGGGRRPALRSSPRRAACR